MGLPGLTTSQMIEVDRIMMEDLGIPLELMMEHAGLNFARLALKLTDTDSQTFRIVSGSGSNGGGGLVAARKLKSWGFETEIVLPRGKASLRKVPSLQVQRAEDIGVVVVNGFPDLIADEDISVLDAYLGYGFKPRDDEISERVFSYLRSESKVISLDVPSGQDSTTGESHSQLKPMATMSIAFLKIGLLSSPKPFVGDLYVADIGVPKDVYISRLELSWNEPYSTYDLDLLYRAFVQDPLQKANISGSSWSTEKQFEVIS